MKYKGWSIRSGGDLDAYYLTPCESDNPNTLYQIKAYADLVCKHANESKFHPGKPREMCTPGLSLITEIIKIRMERGLIV